MISSSCFFIKKGLPKGSPLCFIQEFALCKAHNLISEDAGIHFLNVLDDGLECHMIKDILLKVNARSNLSQLNAFRCKLEYSTLSYISNILACFQSILAGEGNLLYILQELVGFAFLIDHELAVLNMLFEAAGCESTAVENLLSGLGDVDESAASCDLGTELGNVDIAVGVALRKAQECDIKSAAIVEVELEGLRKDTVGVRGNTEVTAACRDTADGTGLCSQNHTRDTFLGNDLGNALRHTDTKVYNSACLELHSAAASDDLSVAHLEGLNSRYGNSLLTGVSRIVLSAVCLHMVLRICNNDTTIAST